MICKNCGSNVNENSNFCTKCGCKIENIQPIKEKNAFLFGLLSFIFPITGFILFFVLKKDKPKSSKTCLILSVIGFITCFIALITMLFLFGLFSHNTDSYSSYKSLEDKTNDDRDSFDVIGYINEKYDDDCSFYEYYTDSIDYDFITPKKYKSYKMRIKCAKLGEELIEVSVTFRKNENKLYKAHVYDNYVYEKYRDQYDEEIKKQVKQYFSEYKIISSRYRSNMLSDAYDKNTTFEQCTDIAEARFFCIYIKENSANDIIIKNIFDNNIQFKVNGVVTSFSIYSIKDEDYDSDEFEYYKNSYYTKHLKIDGMHFMYRYENGEGHMYKYVNDELIQTY